MYGPLGHFQQDNPSVEGLHSINIDVKVHYVGYNYKLIITIVLLVFQLLHGVISKRKCILLAAPDHVCDWNGMDHVCNGSLGLIPPLPGYGSDHLRGRIPVSSCAEDEDALRRLRFLGRLSSMLEQSPS